MAQRNEGICPQAQYYQVQELEIDPRLSSLNTMQNAYVIDFNIIETTEL